MSEKKSIETPCQSEYSKCRGWSVRTNWNKEICKYVFFQFSQNFFFWVCLTPSVSCGHLHLPAPAKVCSCAFDYVSLCSNMDRIQLLRREYQQARREGMVPSYEELDLRRRGHDSDPHRVCSRITTWHWWVEKNTQKVFRDYLKHSFEITFL